MRTIGLILGFVISTSTAFGQQFLWSTQHDSAGTYLELEHVIDKVLEYYDHYDLYVDGTGFSKVGFFKTLESSESFQNSDSSLWINLKKKILDVDSLTVFAFKTNFGEGFVILVMCISAKNVDLISFSNNYESNPIMTFPSDKVKFAKWFRTLLESS
ncbi:MAG: hypothetical protein ACI9JN_001063 [Bacteroidia bacterium]|jgi:hypothetical protein